MSRPGVPASTLTRANFPRNALCPSEARRDYIDLRRERPVPVIQLSAEDRPVRIDIAYLLIAALAGMLAVAIVMTRRYGRYQSQLLRGHRPAKPVRKPFWMP